MIALHHWRDNTLRALDALHVCTSVVRHAKSAGNSNTRNGSSATLQARETARTQRTITSKITGMRQKRAELRLKQRLKQARKGT
jgi:hypothetical protein